MLRIIVFVALILCIPSGCTLALDKNPAGWYWPLTTFSYSESGNWLAKRGKTEKHLGVDMFASVGQEVRAMTDGIVYSISKNGWGKKNVAVLIKHKLPGKKKWIIALYGCIQRATAPEPGSKVSAGDGIGRIGKPRSGKSHLHFAVAAPGKIPESSYGSSKKKNHNHFIDPVIFLTSKAVVSRKNPVSLKKNTKDVYWPLNKFRYSTPGKWLALRGRRGDLHLGVDMFGALGQRVRAVTGGRVYAISKNGWGRGNVAMLIKHQLDDGRWFIALYGHMKKSSVVKKKGAKVSAGETIGRLGKFRRKPHVHFGIAAPGKIPGPRYGHGRKKNHYNFINPIKFISQYDPKK
ncbi:MAG: M23 family metallopeptidase [Candidatus Electrothrix sp. AR3]|nr:M23 family metallopeptidase [Candidatus Electrothrix sp. AR3]